MVITEIPKPTNVLSTITIIIISLLDHKETKPSFL